jgi:hypothetical protein
MPPKCDQAKKKKRQAHMGCKIKWSKTKRTQQQRREMAHKSGVNCFYKGVRKNKIKIKTH